MPYSEHNHPLILVIMPIIIRRIIINILSRVIVTIDGYWIDNCVYWISVHFTIHYGAYTL
jgi:hypothetical protein